MAIPKCPSCNSTTFELKDLKPAHSRLVLTSVQCQMCGAVVAAEVYPNLDDMFHGITKQMRILEEKVDRLIRNLRA